MNAPARKTKKMTISQEWTFDSASLPPNGASLDSPSFGGKQTRFHLSALRETLRGDSNTAVFLHLESSPQKSISVSIATQFKRESSTSWLVRLLLREPSMSWSSFTEPFTKVFSANSTQSSYRIGDLPYPGFYGAVCEVTFEEEDLEPLIVETYIDHGTHLYTQLSNLRLDASSADITLITTLDGRSFPAHRLILSTRSSVFAAMFRNGEFTENKKKQLEITDITGQVMEALLKYVYSGDVGGIEGIAVGLLIAADKYNLPLLVEECAQSIVSHLTVTNAAYFYHFSTIHQLAKLKTKIGQFMAANLAAVRQSDGFERFIKPDSDLIEEFIDLII